MSPAAVERARLRNDGVAPDAARGYEEGRLMARQAGGHVFERLWVDGETVSFVAKVRVYGRYEKVTLGTNKQGWNRTRAELEAEKIVQQIERGTWVPPRLQPREDRLGEAMAELGVHIDESFRVFAKRWWRSKQLGLDEDTVNDYQWRLSYLERFFGRYRLRELTPQLVDRFRDELHEQAETIRRAQERARTEKGRRPLMETVTDKRGRTYERRRRPLSNTSINAMITLLGQILQQALDYELIDRNPVRVGGRSARFLKRVRPNRTFLEVDEHLALLDAAGELEAEARRDFKGLGRRAMVATLGLAGLRISEMMDLRVAQVDLVRSRFKLADAKTEAGVREVEITLYLRDELLAHVMDRQARGLPLAPSDHFFGTATGRRRDPDRFRDRILARAAERASANRQAQGFPPLPAITPHSLRRTWATFAAMIGRDPKWIAAQIGHTSPAFTFSVYQQVATRRFIDEQAVWTLMRFADEPAERALSRQITRADGADARGSIGVEKGEFDRALEWLTDTDKDDDGNE
jgi:integrase